MLVSSSPERFAGYCVLLRLCVARDPPLALCSLTSLLVWLFGFVCYCSWIKTQKLYWLLCLYASFWEYPFGNLFGCVPPLHLSSMQFSRFWSGLFSPAFSLAEFFEFSLNSPKSRCCLYLSSKKKHGNEIFTSYCLNFTFFSSGPSWTWTRDLTLIRGAL